MYQRRGTNRVDDDRSRDGLRRSIDAAADELGGSVADDIPSTPDRIRSRLPDDPNDLIEASDREIDRPLRGVLDDSPLDRFLE